jgi:hypothetical protein
MEARSIPRSLRCAGKFRVSAKSTTSKKKIMRVKIASRNRLTLPKAALIAIGPAEYFDVEVRDAQIVLRPVRFQRADVVRAKLAELGLGSVDVAQSIRWVRDAAAAE